MQGAARSAARRLACLRYAGRARQRVRCQGLDLVFDTRHPVSRRWFFPRYASGRPHEPGVCRALLAHLGPGDVFFDVGANLGFFTVLGACRGAAVHAFEVDPLLVSLAADSLRLNPAAAPVALNCLAVADRSDGLVGFAPHQEGNRSTNAIAPHAGDVRVSTITLDDYVLRTGVCPDVVKMDIEGGEAEALAGARATLARHRPYLVLEVHGAQLAARGVDAVDLAASVVEMGYEAFRLDGYRGEAGDLRAWTGEELGPVAVLAFEPSSVKDDGDAGLRGEPVA